MKQNKITFLNKGHKVIVYSVVLQAVFNYRVIKRIGTIRYNDTFNDYRFYKSPYLLCIGEDMLKQVHDKVKDMNKELWKNQRN